MPALRQLLINTLNRDNPMPKVKFPIPQREDDDTRHAQLVARRSKRRRRRPLERDLENDGVKFVRRLGGLARKMNGLGYRAWPDRLLVRPPWSCGLATLWVEFKLPGEEPTPLQARMHRQLRSRGHRVEVVDTFGQFVSLIRKVWGDFPRRYAKTFRGARRA